jgi:hypothetical protein
LKGSPLKIKIEQQGRKTDYRQWPAIQTQPPLRRIQWPSTQTAAGRGLTTQLPGTQT